MIVGEQGVLYYSPLFLWLCSFLPFLRWQRKQIHRLHCAPPHPAPPPELTYRDKVIGLTQEVQNPFRHLEKDDKEAFKAHVDNGRRVYYQNCFYCHGDDLDGEGHFAHGFNPPPANFQDPGIIPNYQEAFFFWRISKGGPGLPPRAAPWDSAMPVWEDHLTEEEIWDVILFLSEYTGYRPRTFGEAAH